MLTLANGLDGRPSSRTCFSCNPFPRLLASEGPQLILLRPAIADQREQSTLSSPLLTAVIRTERLARPMLLIDT